MSDLSVFAFDSQAVRVVMVDGEPWFVGKDVAEVLGYTNHNKALGDHCKGVTKRYPLSTPGGTQELRIISEPDMLRLIVGSKLPTAEAFERWVFEEVLPSIRKTGQYKMHQEAQRLGITFDFTEAQWEWLRLRPYLVDLLPLAAAGYNSVEITRMLGYNTLTGITARKQIEKLKELGFLPQVIEPRVKQLERRIKAERLALQ